MPRPRTSPEEKREKANERNRKFRLAHPERIAEYYKINRERIREVQAVYSREWRKRPEVRAKEMQRRKEPRYVAIQARYRDRHSQEIAERRLYTRNGISVDQYNALYEKQGGVCAICGKPEDKKPRLSIDHDHRCCSARKCCGKCVRGLLCHRCNVALGLLGDTPELLERAASYVAQRSKLTSGESQRRLALHA